MTAISNKTFSVHIRDLDDGPRELSGPLTREWLQHILKDTDVQPADEDAGRIDLTLTKSGSEVLVQGRMKLTVSVPCARTLDPAVYHLRPDVFLMLVPASGSVTEGTARRRRDRDNPKKTGKNGAWDGDRELSEEEAAQDTYTGDQVILDEFLREFILLEIPMVPLREDLRGAVFEANPPLPGASDAEGKNGEKPLDPRLSPLAELKARLEKKE